MSTTYISAFDMLKIGIGPSSSHTMGPWKAMQLFIAHLHTKNIVHRVTEVNVYAYGSLAKTGKGHGTDIALILGLENHNFRTIPVHYVQERITEIALSSTLRFGDLHDITFHPDKNVHLMHNEILKYHPNGIRVVVTYTNEHNQNASYSQEYFSVGGGFIEQEQTEPIPHMHNEYTVPYPFNSGASLLKQCEHTGLSIADIMRANECAVHGSDFMHNELRAIWRVMYEAIYMGISTEGALPVTRTPRRACALMEKLLTKKYDTIDEWFVNLTEEKHNMTDFSRALNLISCFAIAVNEQNACFGRVVTSPTNGSAGVIPATLLYYFCSHNITEDKIIDFLLTAAAIGSLFKANATISAAKGGCQAEIGVSSSMAASAITTALGGTPQQACMAAEIAMEHHLGLTCDPIGGLVQIPCIERNAMGAIKAVTAAHLALASNPDNSKVSLDEVIASMWETALGMGERYRETAEGGLAIKVSLALADC